MIHLKNTDEVFSNRNTWMWLLSALKAGFINSAGFLATGKFVSHVTGFGTQVGVAIGHDDLLFGAELLIIPISFIMGGVVTSLLLDKKLKPEETPPYHLVQGLITLLILAVILLGESSWVNIVTPFDNDLVYNLGEFTVIALLCFICGLKNALVTWTTFGKIRVTHLTGLSTDIGLHLVRTLTNRGESQRFKEDRKVNIIRIATFLCFSTGAFISAFFFPAIGYKTFIIVLMISLLMTIYSLADYRARTSLSNKSKNSGEAIA